MIGKVANKFEKMVVIWRVQESKSFFSKFGHPVHGNFVYKWETKHLNDTVISKVINSENKLKNHLLAKDLVIVCKQTTHATI